MLAVALPTSDIEWTSFEGSVRGFLVLRDLSGRRLADGDFVLRWEGAMAEPDDYIIRVDLLPGGTSEAAVPVATSGTRK